MNDWLEENAGRRRGEFVANTKSHRPGLCVGA